MDHEKREALAARCLTAGALAAEPGREYWICVNKPDETSRIFVPVSRENSIRAAED